MKKMFLIPLLIGCVLGSLDFACWAADFLIPLGPYGATAPQEVFSTMSASLGGPLALSVTSILHELGNLAFSLKSLLPPGQVASKALMYSLSDFLAHILSAMVVAYCFRILSQRAKTILVFLGGWLLVIFFYYALLVLMQYILIGLVIDLPPLPVLYLNFLPEFLVVGVVTTLFWITLPARFHRPFWVERRLVLQSILNKR